MKTNKPNKQQQGKQREKSNSRNRKTTSVLKEAAIVKENKSN
jgi:hypothetical protein